MSEDVGVKAPVTRLRRRLSVESDEVKSPAGITTPTKKKGGRLATKPQLDLIEEMDAEHVPKRTTRKTAVKDIIESVEEKPMTPSRRSARIRSNTSIVSDTPQGLNSPRAKRAAARRTSQAGSDNDTPLTPARQTRRTRKDSTSSIDKQVDNPVNKISAATEIIVEEKELCNDESSVQNRSTSKSPKLRGRRDKNNSLSKSSNEIEIKHDNDSNTSNSKGTLEINEESSEFVPITTASNSEKNDTVVQNNNVNADSNDTLTEKYNAKKNNSKLHISASAIEESKSFKSKRHRTKSGSAITANNTNDCSFFSDNEISKKKRKNKSLTPHSNENMFFSDNEIYKKKNNKSLNPIHNSNKEAELLNTDVTTKINRENEELKLRNSPKNTVINEESMTTNESINNSIVKAGWKKNIINQIQTENMLDSKANHDYISPIKCFEKAPGKDIQSVVFIEDDSDSNPGNNDRVQQAPPLDSEDQCVPVVKHNDKNNSNAPIPHDNSYEPMDIDESIQQNTSIITSMQNSPKVHSQLETQKQSSVSMELSNDFNNLSSNKSKRKSLLSSECHNNEKSSCESKSSLILSQIKDTSCNEIIGKSPKVNSKEQLSKSINIPGKIKNKEAETRKISLDYSTSTPLQQKSGKKLGVPIDTSLISPNNVNKPKRKSVNKKESKSDVESNVDSDDSGAEITKTQNEFIDDEAEEASEDYQSGDSQDEDEKKYEEQNEIVEKGETLDTDEEFSDNTDYEKDSFIVSSDEEDEELLSGSGDDLSMSDNELSMSAKSKKKYNEKKVKEQKKASREMYEARHKLDDSDKSLQKSKSKKNNRQRLESSGSDEEITIQSKKNNRQRIDSSQDLSEVKSNNSKLVIKKKKYKRLSESDLDESVFNEQEITVCSESKVEHKDPISVAIKYEPNTPQKDYNLSVVVINDNIEEINVDQNASIIKPNETSDPLQATILESDEYSSSSEDEREIINNYDSVLENLSSNLKEIKKQDVSLNINKKQKNVKESIVDELNLTHTKLKKHINKSPGKDKDSSQAESHGTDKKNQSPIEIEDDDASDSIDMRLLFTEDSNDSESNTVNTAVSEVKDFIPLKKTEAKTNLLEDVDTTTEVNNLSLLNESKKKNKIRASSHLIPDEDSPSSEKEKVESFFIDTTGTRNYIDEPLNSSLNNSSKKKKTRNSECDSNVTEVKELFINNEKAVGKKTPKKSANNTETQIDTEIYILSEDPEDISTKTPQSSKKKKKGKKSLNVSLVEAERKQSYEIAQDELTLSAITSQSGNKKKKSLQSLDESGNKSQIQVLDEKEQNELSLEMKPSSDKKKKKAKKSLTDIQNDSLAQLDEISDVPIEGIHHSEKRRKSSQSNVDVQTIVPLELHGSDDQDEPPLEISYRSDKKQKSSLESQESGNLVINEMSFNTFSNSTKKRKQKSGINTSTTIDPEESNEVNIDHGSEEVGTKTRKRKRSATTQEYIPVESYDKETYKTEQLNESSAGSQKKKRKLTNNLEGVSTQNEVSTKDNKEISNIGTSGPTKLKKNKHVIKQENIQIIDMDTQKTKIKKRKERDDDDTTNVTKIFKQNSFDKVHVTRLPSHILNQLGDKPNKNIIEAKRAKVISTSNFTVEETRMRRNKPSNYLEESVYLNDDALLEKKQKRSTKKPKVLPFIPTASTSDSGFTTNFRINLLPRETQFVAQATNVDNFKKDYLQQQKLKKFGTFEKYKNQRNAKLSKF